jgi:uncharacterized membrane protein
MDRVYSENIMCMIRKIYLLRILISITLVSFFSCGRVENSSSQDKAIYGGVVLGTDQFNAANVILRNKCTFCHTHASWNAYTEADFIAAGLIVPQSIVDSKLYYRIEGTTLGGGPKNMPSAGNPTMTTDEITVVTAWINSIN